MKPKRMANEIDKYVGRMIKAARKELKLSQENAGEIMDVTFQQVQKYERGENRIAAGRLFAFSKATGKPLTFFFPTEV